ncbi:MAG: pentapeptide repeat-containing protein [Chloroflexota bacterium]
MSEVQSDNFSGEPNLPNPTAASIENTSIETEGGTVAQGNVSVGGDFAGRDSYTVVYNNTHHLSQHTVLGEGEVPRQVKRPNKETYANRTELEITLESTLLAPESKKIVFVQGLHGTGKTTLVGEVVNRESINEKFPDGTILCDLSGRSISDMLFRLMRPFDPSLEFDPKISHYDYYQKAKEVLNDKKVLIVARKIKSESRLQNLFFDAEGVTLLCILDQKIPNLEDQAERIDVAEMSEPEAIDMLKKGLSGYLNKEYGQSVFSGIVSNLNFAPIRIALAADMIRQRKYDLNVYLEDLRSNKVAATQDSDWFDFNNYLDIIFNSLPELSQRILPYLGLFGPGHITANAIATISRYSRDEITQALGQMIDFDLVEEVYSSEDFLDASNPYVVRERVREFALIKLAKVGQERGEQSVNVLRALMAEYYLSQASSRLWQGKWEFINQLLKIDQNVQDKKLGVVQAFKHVDTTFDQMLINNPNAPELWSKFFIRDDIKQLRTHLEEAFDWVILQEDWPMVRRFFEINLRGAYEFSSTSVNDKSIKAGEVVDEHKFSSRRFVHIHQFSLKDKKIFGIDFKAVRLLGGELTNVMISFSKLIGVQIQSAHWQDVDIVGIEAAGLHAIDLNWKDVDARMGDFRGAVFEECTFENVDFRGAQLGGAIFHDCKLINCDFRRKAEKSVYVSAETRQKSRNVYGL